MKKGNEICFLFRARAETRSLATKVAMRVRGYFNLPHKLDLNLFIFLKRWLTKYTYNSLIMVLAVTAISDIIHIISRFFAQKSGTLCTRDMKSLFTSGTIARHARTGRGPALAPLLLAQVTGLEVSVGRHQGQNNWLHGSDISEPVEKINKIG